MIFRGANAGPQLPQFRVVLVFPALPDIAGTTRVITPPDAGAPAGTAVLRAPGLQARDAGTVMAGPPWSPRASPR
jgi:hypothetical protein